jgi:hypothetical protein
MGLPGSALPSRACQGGVSMSPSRATRASILSTKTLQSGARGPAAGEDARDYDQLNRGNGGDDRLTHQAVVT